MDFEYVPPARRPFIISVVIDENVDSDTSEKDVKFTESSVLNVELMGEISDASTHTIIVCDN